MELLIAIAALLRQEADRPETPFEATVTVSETQVRSTRRSMSDILETLKEKDKVTVIDIQDGKARIRTAGGVVGWVNETSVLETGRYVAKEQAAGSNPAAGAESHAYAKGFDPETETRFKTEKNLQAQYAILDKLEAAPAYRRNGRQLTEQLRKFQKEGNLGEFRK